MNQKQVLDLLKRDGSIGLGRDVSLEDELVLKNMQSEGLIVIVPPAAHGLGSYRIVRPITKTRKKPRKK